MQALILRKLLEDEAYCRKVIPFLTAEYFDDGHRVIFSSIATFVGKYNKLPNLTALRVEMEDSLNEKALAMASDVLTDMGDIEGNVDEDWLLEKTEKFCQDRAVTNAVLRSLSIIEGKDDKLNRDAIPELLTDALAITFDTKIGHDYIEDAEARFDFYNRAEEKIPFDIGLLNTITRGGSTRKALHGFLASTGVGKSTVMCHMAANNLREGLNVLYVTLEMSEEKISQRIDANLLNVPISDIERLPRDTFLKRVDAVKAKTNGKLIVKEYPTSAAHVGHLRALLRELKIKKNFVPDVLYVDYINIMASSRLKAIGGSVNSYTYIKAIAEELRGLMVEEDLCGWTATQSNREGANSSDVDLTNTSESFGLPATLDLFIAIISTEELENLGQIMLKQLKNRYNDVNYYRRFVVGIDRSKMRLYDVSNNAQPNQSSGTSAPPKPGSSEIPVADMGAMSKDFSEFKV